MATDNQQSLIKSTVRILVGNPCGSGFILNDGEIVTNYHVVELADPQKTIHFKLQLKIGEDFNLKQNLKTATKMMI